ncbi:MAG TPA: OmpA family protein [Longimicrobiaceae bacterium]|nr:OmpA family protein [Longimicrobiaceae bacterium]
MKNHSRLALVALALGTLMGGCASATDYLGDRLEQELDQRTRENIDQAVEGGADRIEGGTEDAVRCAFDDSECAAQARAEGKSVEVVGEDGNVVSTTGMGSIDANYDFVPGERTLFAEDFAGDNVGDFPRRLEFVNGNMEIVEYEGGRALRGRSTGAFDIELPEVLPERFTLEFDYYAGEFVNGIRVRTVDAEGEPVGTNYLQVDAYARTGVGIGSDERGGVSATDGAGSELVLARMTPVRLMADGSYVKVYVGTMRVANIPNADFGRSRTIRFILSDVRSTPVYIANIRVAAGGRDLYSTLSSEGRVTAEGILFDTGSDGIRPESTAALQEIGTMLQEHPDLSLAIEGHTDNVGDPAANQALSQRRAAAVRQYLVSNFGIDAGRLTAVGHGADQPVASNDTPAGRQQNRRVELVRR